MIRRTVHPIPFVPALSGTQSSHQNRRGLLILVAAGQDPIAIVGTAFFDALNPCVLTYVPPLPFSSTPSLCIPPSFPPPLSHFPVRTQVPALVMRSVENARTALEDGDPEKVGFENRYEYFQRTCEPK